MYLTIKMTYFDGLLTVDPDVVSGVPVFTGTRVPVQVLMDHLGYEHGLHEFLLGYPGVSEAMALQFLQQLSIRLTASTIEVLDSSAA
jgi:uncharacterized protein (DUF433 family)